MNFFLGWAKTVPSTTVATRSKDHDCKSSRAALDRPIMRTSESSRTTESVRKLYEEIQLNKNWYDNGRQRIVVAIANMSMDQQRQFAANADLQNYIADILDQTVGEFGLARETAHLLLDTIAAGRLLSSNDIFVRLAKHATAIFSSDTDVVADVTEAFESDELLVDTIIRPRYPSHARISRNFAELLRRAMSARAFETSGMKLLQHGFVPLANRAGLDAGWTPDKEKIVRELLNATTEEKSLLLQDNAAGRELRCRTIDWLNDKQKNFVMQAWRT